MKISIKKLLFYILLFFIVQAVFIFLKKDLKIIEIANREFTYSSKAILVYFGLLVVDFINSRIGKKSRNT
mgnify:CR=1 FL=1